MSEPLVAAVGCALLAGALLPPSSGRGLDRLGAARTANADVSDRSPGRRLDRLRLARSDNDGVPSRRWVDTVVGWILRGRAAEQNRNGLIELADALSAELRAGAAPREALWRAAREDPRFASVAAAARSPAGDVVAMLHELATFPGGAAAADLAAAWAVCETTGGRLAPAVARLTVGWRDEEQVRREVSAQLAGPRATAVLLAGLPLVGLAMGAGLGADPIALIRQPSMVLVVAAPGLLLEVAGLLWTARITRRAATW
jgi:tight adherence protein B